MKQYASYKVCYHDVFKQLQIHIRPSGKGAV